MCEVYALLVEAGDRSILASQPRMRSQSSRTLSWASGQPRSLLMIKKSKIPHDWNKRFSLAIVEVHAWQMVDLLQRSPSAADKACITQSSANVSFANILWGLRLLILYLMYAVSLSAEQSVLLWELTSSQNQYMYSKNTSEQNKGWTVGQNKCWTVGQSIGWTVGCHLVREDIVYLFKSFEGRLNNLIAFIYLQGNPGLRPSSNHLEVPPLSQTKDSDGVLLGLLRVVKASARFIFIMSQGWNGELHEEDKEEEYIEVKEPSYIKAILRAEEQEKLKAQEESILKIIDDKPAPPARTTASKPQFIQDDRERVYVKPVPQNQHQAATHSDHRQPETKYREDNGKQGQKDKTPQYISKGQQQSNEGTRDGKKKVRYEEKQVRCEEKSRPKEGKGKSQKMRRRQFEGEGDWEIKLELVDGDSHFDNEIYIGKRDVGVYLEMAMGLIQDCQFIVLKSFALFVSKAFLVAGLMAKEFPQLKQVSIPSTVAVRVTSSRGEEVKDRGSIRIELSLHSLYSKHIGYQEASKDHSHKQNKPFNRQKQQEPKRYEEKQQNQVRYEKNKPNQTKYEEKRTNDMRPNQGGNDRRRNQGRPNDQKGSNRRPNERQYDSRRKSSIEQERALR